MLLLIYNYLILQLLRLKEVLLYLWPCRWSNLGADNNLSKIHSDLTTALFSESNSRFVVTLSSKNKNKFLKVFENIEVYEVGVVNKTNVINFQNFFNKFTKIKTNL